MSETKTILVVCGSGIATSTAAALELKEKLEERGLQVKVKQTDVFSIGANLEGVDLIASTCAIKGDFGVPVVNAVPLLTGIGTEEVIDEIVRRLQSR
ncbi:MAG TPA: PTS sugar transporter subunit IIB [Firmicutes bacterium]|nr:PTS sugar transporter subunit IIB [Bacillota bacterium]